MNRSTPPRNLPQPGDATSSAPTRRHVLAGLGVAGAAGVAVSALPLAKTAAPVMAPAALAPAPEAGGGYQVTQHVLRYYQTAKV